MWVERHLSCSVNNLRKFPVSPDWSMSRVCPLAGTQHRGYRGPHGHSGGLGHRLGRARLAFLRGEKEEAVRGHVQTQCRGAVRCAQRGSTGRAKATKGGATHLRFSARTKILGAPAWRGSLSLFWAEASLRAERGRSATSTRCVYRMVPVWPREEMHLDVSSNRFLKQLNISSGISLPHKWNRNCNILSLLVILYLDTFSCFSCLNSQCRWLDSL